jgi:hypothetical protein
MTATPTLRAAATKEYCIGAFTLLETTYRTTLIAQKIAPKAKKMNPSVLNLVASLILS